MSTVPTNVPPAPGGRPAAPRNAGGVADRRAAATPHPMAGGFPGVGGAAAASPPFRLPGEHFAAAMVFLAFGAVALVVLAPELSAGMYLSPRAAALTHLFTLGWITTSILGALYQFLPVALGNPIRSIPLAHFTFALYVPGIVAFASGLILGVSGLMVAGAATFGTALLLFIGNLGVTLARAPRRDVTWWSLTFAAFFLLITVTLGLALAGNLRWGYLGDGRLTALGTHAHVALGGWVLLIMIGVAHRLLPMFLLSHGAGDKYAKAATALVASGAGVLAFLHHMPAPVSRWLPALLLAAGLCCFLEQARRFYRTRRRPTIDPGMRLAAIALGFLAVAMVLAGPVVLAMASPRMVTGYVLAILLGISLFVAAHFYKIVPFLVWYHRFGPLAGKRPVPRVAELYSARVATTAAALLVAGAAALVAAVLLGIPGAARGAALVFTAGVGVEAAQMISLARRRP